jgi:uncharacterized membrane protein YqaE (UPF0057 family)
MSGSCGLTNDMDNVSLYNKMMYGGLGYGTFCIPKELPNYIIAIVFPPLSVFVQQMKTGFKRVDKIIICFILTSFFYFPGLLYALNDLSCGGLGGSGPLAKCGAKETDKTQNMYSNLATLPLPEKNMELS